jgi:phosphatidylinositol-binding clathrin assembly protein
LEGKDKGKTSTLGSATTTTKAPEKKAALAGTAANDVVNLARPDPTNPFNALTGNNPPQAKSITPNQSTKQDLVDFFASIENEQTPIFPTSTSTQYTTQVFTDQTYSQSSPPGQFVPTQQQQFYPTPQFPSFAQQPGYPSQPIQPEWTGAGFGGYTPSTASSVTVLPTIPAVPTGHSPVSLQSPGQGTSTGTNPFRTSVVVQGTGTNPFSQGRGTGRFSPTQGNFPALPSLMFPSQQQVGFTGQQQGTFPAPQTPTFTTQQQGQTFPVQQPQQTFPAQQTQTFQQQQTFAPPPATPKPFQAHNFPLPTPSSSTPFLQPSSTGTNPFSRTNPAASRLTPQVTGSNPFRQSLLPQTNGPSAGTNGFTGWNP